jgi:hypothetical protein
MNGRETRKGQLRVDNTETQAMNGRDTRKGQLKVDYTETQAMNGRDTLKWQLRVGLDRHFGFLSILTFVITQMSIAYV